MASSVSTNIIPSSVQMTDGFKIPLIIHQIWFQGLDRIPTKYKVFQDTWKSQDGFVYFIWDKFSIETLIETVKRTWKETYFSFPTMIQKIDFAKYIILHVYGGIYIDMDVFAVNSLKSFLSGSHTRNLDFLVFQHNTPYITVTMNKMMGLEGNRIINNAVIFSSPNNFKIERIINACCVAQRNWKKDWLSLQLRCLVTTGPIVFTNSIRTFDDWKTFTFPTYVFEPYTTLEMATFSGFEGHVTLNDHEDVYRHLMVSLKDGKSMKNVVGIHVLDLNWFTNGKNNWKFRAYRSLQYIKKRIISVGVRRPVSCEQTRRSSSIIT